MPDCVSGFKLSVIKLKNFDNCQDRRLLYSFKYNIVSLIPPSFFLAHQQRERVVYFKIPSRLLTATDYITRWLAESEENGTGFLGAGWLCRETISVRINLLFYLFFSTVVPSNICVFLSRRPFVVNTTFSTGIVGVEVSSVTWFGQKKKLQNPQDLLKMY